MEKKSLLIRMFALVVAMMCALGASAAEAYACYTSSDSTLTFYYDNLRSSRTETFNLNTGTNNPGWGNYVWATSRVVFDPSFANARPTSTRHWFHFMINLNSITGLNYLNTSEVTDMSYMFYECPGLTSLDLISFNTANVTDMSYMFYGCTGLSSLDLSSFNTAKVTDMGYMFYFYNNSNLTTIYVGSSWNTNAVTNSNNMFSGCTKLVGGKGTTYDANHVDKAYAHIDGGPSNPGYFTDINHPKEAYACYTADNTTLTFYYDSQRSTRPGTTYLLPEPNTYPGWYSDGTYTSITQVVFDPLFAGTRPTSTRRWFYYHSNLQSITGLNYLNTTQVTDMNSMFEGCNNLTSIDVSNFVTDNVTDMGGMFYQCRKLTSLDVTNFNTANVTNMSGMFAGLRLITDLDVRNFNTANVIEMNFMFSSCVALTTLDLSSFNTAKVKGMQIMFSGCSALTTIYVASQWTTDLVTNHNDMFKGCTKLVGGMGTTYDANHVDKAYAHIDGGTSNPGYLTEFLEPYACFTLDNRTLTFYYDSQRSGRTGTTYDLNEGTDAPGWYSVGDSLTNVVFDSSFAEARPTSTAWWFSHFPNLVSITGMKDYLNTSEVTNMRYMFFRSTSLTSIDASGFNTAKVTDMSGMFDDCNNLTSIDVSGWNTANVTDMHYMFYGCNMTSLDLSGFNTGKVTDMSWMFMCCKNLENLNLSGWNTSNVTDMSYMFDDCDNLESLNLSGWNTSNVTDMSCMFFYCYALKNLDLSGWNTGKVTTMRGMFYNCNSLTSLDVSHFTTAKVTNMGSMFGYCTSLTSLDVSHFNTSQVTVMGDMFYKCTGLTSLNLGGWNTANVTDMRYMFRFCSNLTTIYVGSGWTTDAITNSFTGSVGMFDDCTSLVGGKGTTYDPNHTEKEYAHIDGGPSDPGYLTEAPTYLRGDVNGNGLVTIGDVTDLIDYLLTGNAAGINVSAADCDLDGKVSIGDVTALIDYLLCGYWPED